MTDGFWHDMARLLAQKNIQKSSVVPNVQMNHGTIDVISGAFSTSRAPVAEFFQWPKNPEENNQTKCSGKKKMKHPKKWIQKEK